jgi:transposase
MKCKKCPSEEYVKNGNILGKQRYKCKKCGCQFTDTPERGYSKSFRSTAVFLYGVCGMSKLKIGKSLGVSDVSVGNWIEQEAEKMPEPVGTTDSKIVMLDEMCHFVNGKKTKFGSGEPFVGYLVDVSDGLSVIVQIKH